MLKYASLKYDHPSSNLGDNMQSIAAEQFLPHVDLKCDRDALNQVMTDEKHLLLMNGWFTALPQNWPPSESIVPIFVGFHIENSKRTHDLLLNQLSVEYFNRHEPIGCRDKTTAKLLSEKGVRTYYSKCLTLTFPKRQHDPTNGKVFLVDTESIPIPKSIERKAIQITHEVPYFYSDEIKSDMARFLLDMYKNQARLVITTKLHCALPCIAFGVPVIFFGDPHEYRVALLEDLGVKVYKKPHFMGRSICTLLRLLKIQFRGKPIGKAALSLRDVFHKKLINRHVNWDPKPALIGTEKGKLINKVKNEIRIKESAYG
jgi:hypothetical protein